MKYFADRQMVFCPGNHELFGKQLKRMGFGDTNYCVRFDNAVFIVLTIQYKVFIETANISQERADEAMCYLNKALDENQDAQHIFVAVHVCPFLSDKDLRPTNQRYARTLLNIIEMHPNIRAVFSGHDHLLSAFKVGNCYLKMAGPGGKWHVSYKEKLINGPLPDFSGAPFHLFTADQPHVKTMVTIEEQQIRYEFVDIMDGTVVKEIVQ